MKKYLLLICIILLLAGTLMQIHRHDGYSDTLAQDSTSYSIRIQLLMSKINEQENQIQNSLDSIKSSLEIYTNNLDVNESHVDNIKHNIHYNETLQIAPCSHIKYQAWESQYRQANNAQSPF